jgi:hypothetical protein
VQPVRPINIQATAQIWRPDQPLFLVGQMVDNVGLTMVGRESPGPWTLSVVREVQITEAGLGSDLIIPALSAEVITGESYRQVLAKWPTVALDGSAQFVLRRAVALHFMAREAICNVSFKVNDYAVAGVTPIADLIQSDTLTAWLSPGYPIPHRLPDVIVAPIADAITLQSQKPIPIFAREITIRVRGGDPYMVLYFTNPENSLTTFADTIVVPADNVDHTYTVPGEASTVLAISGGAGTSVAYCHWSVDA